MNVTEIHLRRHTASAEAGTTSRPPTVGTDFGARLARAMGADGPGAAAAGPPAAAPASAPATSDAPASAHATSDAPDSAPVGTRSLTLGQMLHLYALPPGTVQRSPTTPETAGPPAHVAAAGGVRSAAAVSRSANGDDLGVGPVARPLPGAVGSTYGDRVHPVHGGVRMHHGADIGASTGTPIHAFAAGTVTFAGSRGGYGNMVIVEHANGITSRYAHQSAMDVSVGQRVAAGEQLGRVGATGTATGPHLHFELRRDGESFDPGPWLP